MKIFTGAAVSVCLAVGMPLQTQAESSLEAPHAATAPAEETSLPAASESVRVTASETTIQVGELVDFYADFDSIAPSVTEVYGWLRSPVNDNRKIQQERLLRFLYDDKKQNWFAQYTATSYDVAGDWILELWSFSGDVLQKTPNTVSFALNNPKPSKDEEVPQLKDYTFLYNDEPFQDVSNVKQEGRLTVDVQAFDAASGIRAVTAKLLKQQNDIKNEQTDAKSRQTDITNVQTDTKSQQINRQSKAAVGANAEGSGAKEEEKQEEAINFPKKEYIDIPLLYNVQTSKWTGVLEMATAPEGEYELVIEMEDYAGNVVEERTESKILVLGKEKPPQDTEKEIPPASPVEQSPAEQVLIPIVTEPEKASNTPALEQAAPQADKVSVTASVVSDTKKEDAPSLAPKQETTEVPVQQSKQSSLLFYVAGVLLLISVLRSNKEWSE